MQVRNYWLRKLEDKCLIKVTWIPGKANVTYTLTKNSNESDIKRHRDILVY